MKEANLDKNAVWAYGTKASLFARIITWKNVWCCIKEKNIELKQLQLSRGEMLAGVL